MSKVLIDIPDEDYKWLKGLKAKGRRLATKEEAVANGIVLDGLTNGEVIQKIFKISDAHEGMSTMFAYTKDDKLLTTDIDLWDKKWGE